MRIEYPLGKREMAKFELNRLIESGTSLSSVFLFHPNDLEHRRSSPMCWYHDDFSCMKEFQVGNMVCISCDGAHTFRVTTGDLTDRERNWLARSWDYRLDVRHGRVLIDGGELVPEDTLPPEDFEKEWIDLPNGMYRVTIHAIHWALEPGAYEEEDGVPTANALPSCVIRFQEVQSFDEIPVLPPVAELLGENLDYPADYSKLERDYNPPDKEFMEHCDPIEGNCLFLRKPEFLTLPGRWMYFRIPYSSEKLRSNERVVIAESNVPGTLGLLAMPSGGGSSADGWYGQFLCRRFVILREFFSDPELESVRVEPFVRESFPVDSDVLESLKAEFINYAAQSEAFRTNVEYPDYELERFQAMTTAEAITNTIIALIQIPQKVRLTLIPLPDPMRVDRLLELMGTD